MAIGATAASGRQVVKTEHTRQMASSVGVGNWKFQAKQWRPPKMMPPTTEPKASIPVSSLPYRKLDSVREAT